MKRRLVVLMLAVAMLLMLAPTFAATADEQPLEPVTLDWYFGQQEQRDCQLVNDAVNAYLKEKLNLTVNLHYWSGQEYWDRMTTMISAGQDVGIIGFGSQTKLDYVIQSQRGAYYPLDELMDQYAPGTKMLFPDTIWDCMRIGGKIYGVPSLKDNGYFISLVYNDDMAQTLGINVADYQHSNFRELEPLFYAVKEKRDELLPEYKDMPIVGGGSDLIFPYAFAFETFLNDSYLAVCNIDGINDIAGVDGETVTNFYATPEFLDYALQRQKWVADGILAYDYTDKTEWNYDGSLFGWVGWGYTYMPEHLNGDKFVTKMMMSDTVWTDTNNYFSAGTAISAKCANPERAMMLLELANTDSTLATMMRFGIEGTHYTVDAAGKMEIGGTNNADAADRGYFHWYMAPIGNLTIVKAPESLTGPDGIMLTRMKELNASCKQANHMGFTFDTAPVVNDIAACTSIVTEYQTLLATGQLGSQDEVKEVVQEFVDKLNANGVDKIVAEVQRQIDAWKAAK